MPAYNCEAYIKEAVESVLNQSHKNWELLVINDGSTDDTESIILGIDEPRIRYFKQENKGVSAARNVGLANMNGEHFCFLDADDILPKNSLEARLKIFKEDADIEFVDGRVTSFNDKTLAIIRDYKPNFLGNPNNKLFELSEDCFFGPSWMIKVNKNKIYRFEEGLTHAEDLLFYLSISSTGVYSFTTSEIYKYRIRSESAMANLDGLTNGYKRLLEIVTGWSQVTDYQRHNLRKKIRSILFKTYLRNIQPLQALKMLFI